MSFIYKLDYMVDMNVRFCSLIMYYEAFPSFARLCCEFSPLSSVNLSEISMRILQSLFLHSPPLFQVYIQCFKYRKNELFLVALLG